MNYKYIECSCDDSEHVIRFTYIEPVKDYPELYTEVQLRPQHFFQRVWKALKYIFGYQSKYGHWDCTILHEKQVKELRDHLTKFLRKCPKK